MEGTRSIIFFPYTSFFALLRDLYLKLIDCFDLYFVYEMYWGILLIIIIRIGIPVVILIWLQKLLIQIKCKNIL